MSKILVFDSGSGSLPIAKAIQRCLPSAELVLLADSEYFPYGERSDQELIERMQYLLLKAFDMFEPNVIVLACNTASTIALNVLRDVIECPIIGVVPAIKPAAEATESNVIGLIATPATIQRKYTSDLVAEFAADCDVIMQGSTELVMMSENFVETGQYNHENLSDILFPFIEASTEQGLDQLVLGCTHFALLEKPINAILENVAIVDSSEAIARQVSRVLKEPEEIQKLDNKNYKALFYITENNKINKIKTDVIL